MSPSTINLPILAFNDVYRVRQKYTAPAGHATRDKDGEEPELAGKPKEEYISVGQFGRTLLDLRDAWDSKRRVENGVKEGKEEKEGLVLFAGDGQSAFGCRSPASCAYALWQSSIRPWRAP